MSFITDRLTIKADPVLESSVNHLKLSNKQEIRESVKTLQSALVALESVQKSFIDYYKRHKILGWIVEWIDRHSFCGLFGKKAKVDKQVRKIKKIIEEKTKIISKEDAQIKQMNDKVAAVKERNRLMLEEVCRVENQKREEIKRNEEAALKANEEKLAKILADLKKRPTNPS